MATAVTVNYFTATGHLANLIISDRTDILDVQYGVDAVQSIEVEKCFPLAHQKTSSAGRRLREQVDRYPRNPIFLNYLGLWHESRGEHDQALRLLHRTMELFPDYLFANISMTRACLVEDRPEDALNYLHPSLRIEERFKGRTEFHYKEVYAYETMCIHYLLAVDDAEEARIRLDILETLLDGAEDLSALEMLVITKGMALRMREEQAMLEHMPKMEFAKQPASAHADRELVLHHQELRCLFECSMTIPMERLQAILALPRETVVEDLAAIVQHAIDHFHTYRELESKGGLAVEENSFVLHAILLLSELPGAKSLEALLQVYSQSEEFLDFYLGELLTQYGWEPISKLAAGHFDRLTAFMKTPRLHYLTKVMVADGLCRLALDRPQHLAAVEQWYAELFRFYADATPEDEVMDASMLGLMVGDVIEMKLPSLLPEIETLYAKNHVAPMIAGSIEVVRTDLADPGYAPFKRPILPIAERYAELASLEREWISEEDADDLLDEFDDAPLITLPITRALPKVGRNDPCTCGSGKKYKKCCLEKEASVART